MPQLYHATGRFPSPKGTRARLRTHLGETSVASTARQHEKCGNALIFYQTEPTREKERERENETLARLTRRGAFHLLLHNRNGKTHFYRHGEMLRAVGRRQQTLRVTG